MRHDDGNIFERCLVVDSSRRWQKSGRNCIAECIQSADEHGITIPATTALEAVLLDPVALKVVDGRSHDSEPTEAARVRQQRWQVRHHQLPDGVARWPPGEHVGQEGRGIRRGVGADLVVEHVGD